MERLLRAYLQRLTNLSSTNKCLLHLRLRRAQDLDLSETDFALNRPAFSIIDDLLGGKKTVSLCTVQDARDAASNDLSRRLRSLAKRAEFLFEERGAMDLHLGWPFVHGKLSDDAPVRAPLLFFPIRLVIEKDKWVLRLREGEALTWNRSFLLAYSHFLNTPLTQEFLDQPFEDFLGDSQAFRNQLYALLKESPLELQFNRELFEDRIRPFQNFKTQEYRNQAKLGELKLQPEAVLGLYPQAGSYLVPDYQAMLERVPAESLEAFFVDRQLVPAEAEQEGRRDFFLHAVKEEQLLTPFPLDAAQENAVKAVKKGHSLVVQGPPGTGKSQLICNLVADRIAMGEKVLVVCQKRAALDVVHARLSEAALAPFVGLVHDVKGDRKKLYEQLDRQIERIEEYKARNDGLDAVVLEREFLQASRRIDAILEELEAFRTALFREDECGWSPKELYLTTDAEGESLNLGEHYRSLTVHTWPDYVRKLRRRLPYEAKFSWQAHPWGERRSFAGRPLTDLKRLTDLLTEVGTQAKQWTERTEQLLGSVLDREETLTAWNRQGRVEELFNLTTAPQVWDLLQRHHERQWDEGEWYRLEFRVLGLHRGSGIEASVKSDELGRFLEILNEYQLAKKRLDKRIRWSMFNRNKRVIQKALAASKLKWTKGGIRLLRERLDNRLNYEDACQRIAQLLPGEPHPTPGDLLSWQQFFHEWFLVYVAKKEMGELHPLPIQLGMVGGERKTALERWTQLKKELAPWQARHTAWLEDLTESQVRRLWSEEAIEASLKKSLKQDFDALVEYDSERENWQRWEVEVLGTLSEIGPKQTTDQTVAHLENSLRLSWLTHLELKDPVLRIVSTERMGQLERELAEAQEIKDKRSRDLVLLRARERTYRDVTFNRLHNRVTYRELQRQVTKKRLIWPLRRLLHDLGEEVYPLVPCWLASPEAVSSLFPLEKHFDLVIFDEASQCFAEEGLPAMARGRQVVVVGDSQQLQPSDLYRIRWEEEEDDEVPETQIDSLLDMAREHLREVKLTGHYRSRTLDLISFSNEHFYRGELQVIPHAEDWLKGDPAIQVLRVPGQWIKSTNPVEADRVVDLVLGAIKEGETSIGVVTFNYPQQQLIEQRLEEESIARKVSIPAEVFVKNIENVQGDERDHIVFSLGYAPDRGGKMAMQFGLLNQQGGENRLNVAVTRARRRISLVCSILPSQLKVDDTKHEGPKLLRAYLEYADKVASRSYQPTLPDREHHRRDWYLAAQLEADELPQPIHDWKLAPQLPFADLTARCLNPTVPPRLILTDDGAYQLALSAKAAHLLTPRTLGEKGWHATRFHSRRWWGQRDELRERLWNFLARE